jgi:TetR/AcrR family transcriptional regulator, transcriptional repressor for nem operon
MPRAKEYVREDVARSAMNHFWSHGYYATSIEQLVEVTDVSRHGLYSEFGDKRGLFLAAARTYIDEIVTPAFERVEKPGAGISAIREYFVFQISLATKKGLPGPGCLLANTMVESGPHDLAFGRLVTDHLKRLHSGFRQALENDFRRLGGKGVVEAEGLARLLTIASQGLWSVSRVTRAPEPLFEFVNQLLLPIEERIGS